MVDVTVIIPCRNQGDTLERAVASAKQCGASEVIVFDDDSESDIWTWMLRSYSPIPSNIPNRLGFRVGAGIARNLLINRAKCDWIIPLDADDELLRIPELPPNRWCYGGWIERDVTTGAEETFTAPPPAMIRQKPLCHATMMFHKSLWQEAGGYDPDFFFGEDYGLQCAFSAIEPPTHLDYPLYKRYVGKNERTEKAKKYWPVIHDMAKEKYPVVFL